MADIQNYFDYAAATPMLPEVITSMQPYFSDRFYNPSALYLDAQANHKSLELARHTIAQGIGARPTEIIFTAGGTEANNIAIYGIMQAYSDAHIVLSNIEHDSVRHPAASYNSSLVAVDSSGLIDPNAVLAAITDFTVIVSVMYANNEIGSIQPIKDISQALQIIKKDRKSRGINRPLYFHTDACQASNYLDMQVSRLGVDLMTINAGKIYGPKQCGALYVRAGIVLKPLIQGGGQEWNVRSGTENLANIVGFASAWQIIRSDYHNEVRRLSAMRDEFLKTITDANNAITINGANGTKRLANNISLTIDRFDNERLLMMLDEQGMQIATGSACSASHDEPSHILTAIGLTDEQAQNTVRITLGRYTTQASLQNLHDQLLKIVAI